MLSRTRLRESENIPFDVVKRLYATFDWVGVDVRIRNADNDIIFEQLEVECPSNWTDQSAQIVVNKYFRGQGGTPERETSIFQLCHRVVSKICDWGVDANYFDFVLGQRRMDVTDFYNALMNMVLDQRFFWNSPVWFNLGAEGRRQQASACFINAVDDSMESILDLGRTEGILFKGGSGTGSNMSRLRAEGEPLSTGGTSTGPLSFMRGLDAWAGAIKSGGATRRAARMMILDADHPDILDFINCKVLEEDKALALIASGYSAGLNGEAYASVSHQNANHSVRVTDAFMEAVENDADWELTRRTDGGVSQVVKAREVLNAVAEAAHRCGDPGLQYDTTIQEWHTTPNIDRIRASNPCSEYLFLDDTACNLGSFNLLKYYDIEKNTFNVLQFISDVKVATTSMDIIVGGADYPTEEIALNSKLYRTLGLGYSNLGALLMSMGVSYDSVRGRHIAAAITSLMSSTGYSQSALLTSTVGPALGVNDSAITKILARHATAHEDLETSVPDSVELDVLAQLLAAGGQTWRDVLQHKNAPRNAQISVIAPTGTISFAMGCDTTGCEPELALRKFKTLVGGGVMELTNPTALETCRIRLKKTPEELAAIDTYVKAWGTMQDCPHLTVEEQRIFLCSFKSKDADFDTSLRWQAHVDMLAAIQPFISGAISKTVNLDATATVEDIKEIYVYSWEQGLKCVAVYRDESKGAQPLRTGSSWDESKEKVAALAPPPEAQRRRLPDTRAAQTHKFTVAGFEGYITTGFYVTGGIGEVFIKASKEGSTVSGLLDAIAVLMSLGLQHGVPLDAITRKLQGAKFEPQGITTNKEIRFASSIVDYAARYLEIVENQPTTGVLVAAEGTSKEAHVDHGDNQVCNVCGGLAVRAGTCYTCMNCGEPTGCS